MPTTADVPVNSGATVTAYQVNYVLTASDGGWVLLVPREVPTDALVRGVGSPDPQRIALASAEQPRIGTAASDEY
ncbi:hypothetical protein HRF29_03800 [Rathayibacter agropyri]|nr:hypothetical protein [Rathayibacter agropyri]